MKKGSLYLIPVALAPEGTRQVAGIALPYVTTIRHYIVENIRTARRFLKSVDKSISIDDCQFLELDKHADYSFDEKFLKHALNGVDIGLLSEAGCPAVADPGGQVVAAAHRLGIQVKPIVGPSSIIMGLMGSGFTGQSFTFHGYVPIDNKERRALVMQMERDVNRGYTQVFMETPYRNTKLFLDLLEWLHPETLLCIASNITGSNEQIHTRPVKEWKNIRPNLKKVPAVFLIGSF